jgi:hypothetical protein
MNKGTLRLMILSQVIEIWKTEIESINIRGYSRKVLSTSYSVPRSRGTTIEGHYRIEFKFEDDVTINPCNEIYLNQKERDDWKKELESHFVKKFKSQHTGSFSPEQAIKKYRDGIIEFNNEYCDFFGWERGVLVIQSYLGSVISKIREEKLKDLIG